MHGVRYDRFYDYAELTGTLEAWAAEAPELFRLESAGRSYEGREIWLATVTNTKTGPDTDKPAFLLEANIHAIELTGCTAALQLLHRLLSGYGSDPKVTRALDTRAFYVIPRLNPDGAELALSERPRYVPSPTAPSAPWWGSMARRSRGCRSRTSWDAPRTSRSTRIRS